MIINITISDPDNKRARNSLHNWLNNNQYIKENAQLKLPDSAPEGMGSEFDVIQLVLSTGFDLANLALAFAEWHHHAMLAQHARSAAPIPGRRDESPILARLEISLWYIDDPSGFLAKDVRLALGVILDDEDRGEISEYGSGATGHCQDVLPENVKWRKELSLRRKVEVVRLVHGIVHDSVTQLDRGESWSA